MNRWKIYFNCYDLNGNFVGSGVYAKTTYKKIQNDYNVFYWCNRSYKQNSSKIAYSFKIPWGYFNIWRSYWG